MSKLIIIPARGGSKGLPGKNVKILGGKPLIVYSIDFAKRIMNGHDTICISTDDFQTISVAREHGVEVPFVRPSELATDSATTYDVLLHALDFYANEKIFFTDLLLLQPTSPLRKISDYTRLEQQYNLGCDMAVTVKESKDSPYFNLFEEDENGLLHQSKRGHYTRRQDAPVVYAYNGSMYLIKVSSIRKNRFQDFANIRKSIMPAERSVDIDTQADWILTEFFLNNFTNEDS